MARSSELGTSNKKSIGVRQGWVLFVAGRYVRTRRRERRNTTDLLSVIGLAVGVATLITVLSVMNAFQLRQIESIISFNSYHIRIGGVTAERCGEPSLCPLKLAAGIIAWRLVRAPSGRRGLMSTALHATGNRYVKRCERSNPMF